MADETGVLPLEEDLRQGRIERALLCHVHDRWYLGELFCHASWLGSLRGAGIPCSVCTNPAYLELFERLPGVDLFPAQDLNDALLERFDLVIFGTTHPPNAYKPRLPRTIYAWNEGLAFARHGQVELELPRSAPNLFVATCHRHGETALPDGEYPSLHLTEAELATAGRWIDDLLDRDAPVVVFNPSASNAHTRATDRPKAVENRLTGEDCERIVAQLLSELPGHAVLIAAPLKPGDRENHGALTALGGRFSGEPRVLAPTADIDPTDGLTLRAFAALLLDGRVRGMLGNSTGSNTHLAAALDVPAVSLERGADEQMRGNWRSPGRGQMGSFRWRNPHPCTAAVALRWERQAPAQTRRAVRLLRRRIAVREQGWAAALGVDRGIAEARAREALAAIGEPSPGWMASLVAFAELMDPEHRELVFDFRDEAEYFDATGRAAAAAAMAALSAIGAGTQPPRGAGGSALDGSERELVNGMIASSNLFKDLGAAAGESGINPLSGLAG